MFRIAWRSIVTRPARAAVLAGGFGFGIAVMAALLGVGEVILEQAHAPALQGGGDLVISGPYGTLESARFVMSSLLAARDLAGDLAVVSPSTRARLFLLTPNGPIGVSARGGIPSLEDAIGDPEVGSLPAWADTPGDARWSRPDPGDVIRSMDRFHPIPPVPARAESWAEWLYFNGHSRDGSLRVYLTFLAGPHASTPGRRTAGVRLQLEHNGISASYSARGEIDEARLLADAPDLDIAGNRVRLDGLTYTISLALGGASGDLFLDAVRGRSLPPAAIRGAGGWVSGYTAPVLAGTFRGSLRTSRGPVALDGAIGYHDHNWGFWDGVTWQWGQVAHDDLSIVYGRVFPPAEAADPKRVPGFMAVLGPDGPAGFSTDVAISESNTPGRVDVRAHGAAVDLNLAFSADEAIRSSGSARGNGPLSFVQLSGLYRVVGRIGDRSVDFTARGAAETFRTR
jgi:hypothetical protein